MAKFKIVTTAGPGTGVPGADHSLEMEALAGIGADILQRYRVDLRYNGYYGDYATSATGALTVPNGASASLSDSGWVSLTFKTTF